MRAAAATALRSVPRAALSVPPEWRVRIAAAIGAVALIACGYWFWFRDSSFARVHDVYVTGVSGSQARVIRSRLEEAALSQSTLKVNTRDLQQAVADFPVVRSVTAQGDFPHTLTIDVDLNLPVGILDTPSGRKPVAADGLLLPDVPITGKLPVLATKTAEPGDRVTAGRAFQLIRVVGLAPATLRKRITWVGIKPTTGLVATLRDGPELRFGDSSRLAAKWIAAARVLASKEAKGATYVDLRLPERPAAGGLATTTVIPLAPAGEVAAPTVTTPAPAAQTTPQPTAQAVVQNPQPQVQTSPQVSTTP